MKTPVMKYTSLVLCLLCLLTSYASAQNVAAFHDRQGRLQYYDDGEMVQLDHNTAEFFRVGSDFIIYYNSQDEVVYYRKGVKELLHLRNVLEDYEITNHYILIKVGGAFTVIDHVKNHNLSLQDDPVFIAGDSIVAFIDFYGGLKAFYKGEKHIVDPSYTARTVVFSQSDAAPMQVSDNSIAYIDNGDWLQFHKDGETYEIIDIPITYKIGNDLVLYVDEYNEFKMWRDKETIDLSSYAPKSYKVGDKVAAYVDDRGGFYMIREGSLEAEEISPLAPQFYDVIDNTIVFVDERNYFSVYYDGKIHPIEAYRPIDFKYFNGVVTYLDAENRLRAFYEGEVVQVSQDIVASFELYGRVILFELGNGDYRVYHNGVIQNER